MSCSSCRRPPRILRKPSAVNQSGYNPSGTPDKNAQKRSEEQRNKITRLTYVPK